MISDEIIELIKFKLAFFIRYDFSNDLVEESIDLILDKATTEPKYREIYSLLTIKLCKKSDKKKTNRN
jgi:hypothetical protein